MREAVTLKTLLTKDNRFSLQFIGKNSVSSPQQPQHTTNSPLCFVPLTNLCPVSQPPHACLLDAVVAASLCIHRTATCVTHLWPSNHAATNSVLSRKSASSGARAANATRVASFALKAQDTGTRYHYFAKKHESQAICPVLGRFDSVSSCSRIFRFDSAVSMRRTSSRLH